MQRFVKMSGFFIVKAYLLFSALACTRDPAVQPDTLVVALGSQPATLDPRFATDANGMRVVALMFNSLVRIGPALQVEGDAAKTWTYKDKTYHFQLFPGLKFANDRELTKEDIEFSFAQYRSDKSPFKSALDIIAAIEVNGDNSQGFEIKISLTDFSAKFLNSDLPVVKLLPKKEIEEAPEAFSRRPIGTGSFTLLEADNNQIRLKARSNHAIASPKVEFLLFKVIRDEFTRFQKTLKGSIDIAQAEISPSKVQEFEKKPGEFNVYKYPGLSMTYMLVNLEDSLLSQKKVRKALAESINRKEIIQYKLEGLAQEATSILTPGNPYFHSGLENIEYKPENAKQLIQDMDLTGKSITLKTSNTQSAVDNARVLAYQLSKTGLNIQLQSYEWGTFYGDIKAGNFELATMRWIGALDPDIYRLAFHSKEFPPGRNRGKYNNPTLDQLVEEGLKIADEKERIEHYKKVQELIQNDLAIIPLWYDQQVAVVHKRVEGYKPWQTSDFYPFIFVSKPAQGEK